MDKLNQFAEQMGRDIADVTHCVLVGHRDRCEVYAVGYWNDVGYYTTATVEYRDGQFTRGRWSYDRDIEREAAVLPIHGS